MDQGLSKIRRMNQKGAMPLEPAGVADLFGTGAPGGMLARAAALHSNLGGRSHRWGMQLIGKGIVANLPDERRGCYAAEPAGVAEFIRERTVVRPALVNPGNNLDLVIVPVKG